MSQVASSGNREIALPGSDPVTFISYSRDDSQFALKLARDLRVAGANVWLDQMDIPAGQEWDSSIEEALVECPRMLLILSPSSAKSKNVRNEIHFALNYGKPIIPVLYRNCIAPLQLQRIQHVDFTGDYNHALSMLATQLLTAPPRQGADRPFADAAMREVDPLRNAPMHLAPPSGTISELNDISSPREEASHGVVARPGRIATSAPLTQFQRLVNVLIAPSKTFVDVLRSSSWWLPWLVPALINVAFVLSVQQKVGWERADQDLVQRFHVQQPAKVEITEGRMVQSWKFVAWSKPLMDLLLGLAVAGVLTLTVNLGLGGAAKFRQMMAVWIYGTLPWALREVIGIVVIAGGDTATFNFNNYTGTNFGYYMPGTVPMWLYRLGSAVDVFTIWVLILLTIGCSIVGHVRKRQAALVILGWWILYTVFDSFSP
jgi:TIR domain/Yip1 domain